MSETKNGPQSFIDCINLIDVGNFVIKDSNDGPNDIPPTNGTRAVRLEEDSTYQEKQRREKKKEEEENSPFQVISMF